MCCVVGSINITYSSLDESLVDGWCRDVLGTPWADSVCSVPFRNFWAFGADQERTHGETTVQNFSDFIDTKYVVQMVFLFSVPIVLVEELMKAIGRRAEKTKNDNNNL